MSTIVRVLIVVSIIICTGCNPMRDNLSKFNSYIEKGNIAKAADFSTGQIKGGEKPSNDDVVWMLQSGTSTRLLRDYKLSNEYFDRAEGLIKFYREKADKNVSNIWATATNDTALAYEGTIYDGVMLNTYKAINYMITGQYDRARIEFNRATDRQRRAKEFYNTEIEKARAQIKEKDMRAYNNATNSQNMSILERKYPELKNFEPYPGFINPFTSYISALFFYLEGDYDKAEFQIKQTAGIISDNEYINADFENITNRKGTSNTVWVIFENGLGPVKEEIRLDLPLFVSTNKVQYFGVALPRLRTRAAKYPYLVISDGQKRYNTKLLASMDRVIKTEFEKQYPEIFTRAIVSATTKAVAQYALQNDDNSTAALIVAMYSLATTAADCRIWTTLPKEFQIARFEKPDSGRIEVTPASNCSTNCIKIDIGKSGNTIVYIKMIGPGIEPVYEIITF